MPQIRVSSNQRRVLFRRKNEASRFSQKNEARLEPNMVEDGSPTSSPTSDVSFEHRIVEIEDEETGGTLGGRDSSTLSGSTSARVAAAAEEPAVPSLFTSQPQLRDHVRTESSILQDNTVEECLPFLAGTAEQGPSEYNAHGLPRLQRALHQQYLYDALESYPSSFVGYDASRPWILYWSLTGLSLLGENVKTYMERYGRRCAVLGTDY